MVSGVLCTCQVFTQGGYEQEYGSEDKFAKAADLNPTLLHTFTVICLNAISFVLYMFTDCSLFSVMCQS